MEQRSRKLLPLWSSGLLLAAWWFSLIVIWQTPLVELTPSKLLAFLALPLLIAARSWRLIARADRPFLLLAGAYVLWLVVTAGLRGSGHDLKMTIGYAFYFGGAFALAYAAARTSPRRAAIALLAVAIGALAVTLVGAGLERFTYSGYGAPDPLASLWALVRPQNGTLDTGLGPPPLHFSSGNLAILRIASWFAHPNYLAFFLVLMAALTSTLLLAMLRLGRRGGVALAGLGLAGCSVTMVWTYSRAGFIGLLGVVTAVIVTDVILHPRGWRLRSMMLLRAAPLVLVLAVLGVSLATDHIGLRRFTPVVSDGTPPPASAAPGVEASAALSKSIRLAMQTAALHLVTENPRSLLVGPGHERYDKEVHDPTSPYYVAESVGIVDPNSLWLSLGVTGGVVAAVLLAVLLVLVAMRSLVAGRRTHPGSRLWVLAWVAAWIPAWAVVQFVGTFPFNPSEAIILGTLLGAAVGQSGPASGAILDQYTRAPGG